jgi:putative endonuclease
MQNKRTYGSEGEDIAAAFLEGRGFRILERNYHVRSAEIDIIAEKHNLCVFVEVKRRKNRALGSPLEAITPAKLAAMHAAAAVYMADAPHAEFRLDAISIVDNESPSIEHIENILLS